MSAILKSIMLSVLPPTSAQYTYASPLNINVLLFPLPTRPVFSY